MAKKKEKGTNLIVGDGTKRVVKRNDILDTSAGEIILDVNGSWENRDNVPFILKD